MKLLNYRITENFNTYPILESEERVVNQMMNQLGGRRFLAMTGAKPQYRDTKDGNTIIAFKIPRNKSKANFFKLTYVGGEDLYRMEFISIRGTKMTTIEDIKGVYNDQLQKIYTDITGMYTTI